MNIRNSIAALSIVTLIAGSGCSGGGGSHGAAIVPSGPAITSTGSSSPAFAYDTSALKGAAPVGPATFGGRLSVDIIPRLSNPSGLLARAAQVNDPSSGLYRHFLTPAQIAASYGATASDYAAAVKYFQSKGLSVTSWPQRLLLHVTGTETQLENALNTSFAWYSNKGTTFLAPATTPAPPSNVPIIGAANLVMNVSTFVDSVKVNGGETNGLLYGYSPQQIAAAFDYTSAYNAGYTGKGITVGIIGTGGFLSGDVPAYKAMFHVGGTGTATMVSATDADLPGNTASGFATPPPVTAPCTSGGSSVEPTSTCNPEDGETQIDTEQVAGLAYDADVQYFLAYNPNDGCGAIGTPCPTGAGIPLQGLGEIDAELETAIANDTADILSLSFGGPEAGEVGYEFNSSGHGIEPVEFAALASEGIAVFVSSGDSGAEECETWSAAPDPDALCVSYPSTDPNVVSVGGTNTPLNTAGQFIGALTGWGAQTESGFGGSGGGVSAYFPLPSFQQGAVAGIQGSMRNVPDVALNADDHTGVAVMMYGDPRFASADEAVEPFGGTSVATPEMAAMWALVLQACKQTASCATASGAPSYRLGDPNAFFYKIYQNPTEYQKVFYDVLYGNNAQAGCSTEGATPCPTTDPGYQAGTGYDLITGIGVPFARALINAVVGV